ncbi:hypothetical protein [Janthinobacterium sp. 17J80-10]|uniref:hypothetical protein n=1 Tax=Janthinobacterium sp. 17J80-10 TaxID=2497863 RepID=UPI001005557C|nr:hypothetical protein [Janthinobacterium sp. 17J80-10]QAU35143.1 hypothetical protein EKL02_13680 [Janthinobacterium sp. 17J80-10]
MTTGSRASFPKHSGGVVQVTHSYRYGAVPEHLLEDPLLSLDSRAVGAWLAVKPDGWVISIAVLRRRLAPNGKSELGKEKWQRIARELVDAGYMIRKVFNGENGQLTWFISFNPVPERVTIGGFSGSGAAVSGRAVAGKAGHIGIPTEEVSLKKTTTTGKSGRERTGLEEEIDSDFAQLVFEPSIVHLKECLLKILKKGNVTSPLVAQDLLDELAGTLNAAACGKRTAIASPLGWFRQVIKRQEADTFDQLYSKNIQRRRKEAKSLKMVDVASPGVSPTGKEHLAKCQDMVGYVPKRRAATLG